MSPTAGRGTTRLLACGAAAGPLFLVAVLAQDLFRPGVDPAQQPLSLLSLGDLGWIQVTAFVLTGVLFLAGAVGVRRALHPGPAGTWGPALIAALGLGSVIAGVFPPDPAYGFPPGTAPGRAAEASWHGSLHTVGALVVFGSATALTVVFARRSAVRRERAWVLGSLLVAAAVPVLVVLSATDPGLTSGYLRAVAVLSWGWTSVLAARVIAPAVTTAGAARHRGRDHEEVPRGSGC